jgi:tetratricopeptide (TPR) repeat protein
MDKQYTQAAAIYEQLLAYSPNGAEIHNNLGLTLHYLGKSDQALGILEEGVAIDPDNQRIWLTIGYVSRELGKTAQAREALTNAIEGGVDDSIRNSAQQMLDALH